MKLIIVESPTKARTFMRFLKGTTLEIVSSMGHVRDLPKKKIGVEVENNFLPNYEILQGKQKLVTELIHKAKQADEVILATDPDREGEAIAFHLQYLLHEALPNMKFHRIVFHEITQEALEDAIAKPRAIDEHLFDAQQARRILDRLVGYTISPYLWKKFSKYWLSAGRVQTVALRFAVEREKEREKFNTVTYFIFEGNFKVKSTSVPASLMRLKGGMFFTTTSLDLFDGRYTYKSSSLMEKDRANIEQKRLENEKYTLNDVSETIINHSPPPPFTTSSLQQYASTAMGYSAKKTMRVAQSLYEKGLISYHRTDSMTLSSAFVAKARSHIEKKFGVENLSSVARNYKTKVKNAQEAHEAIRPTDATKDSSKLASDIPSDQRNIYASIYKRAIATQMTEAKFKKQLLTFVSSVHDEFIAEAQVLLQPGFLLLYEQKAPTTLYAAEKNDTVIVESIQMVEKQTQSPPQYTEASLIKSLEKRGIGRPSTYAPIVSLIQERQYVRKQERALSPTVLGIKIADLLSANFATVFDVEFTADMEHKLDDIGAGLLSWKKVLAEFYNPLQKLLEHAYENTEKIRVEEQTDEICPECSKKLVIKLSRFGKFYACEGFPECKYTKPFLQKTGAICPQCNKGDLVVRFSRKKRRFYGCSTYPDCDYTSLWLKKEDGTSSVSAIHKEKIKTTLKKKSNKQKSSTSKKKQK